MMPLPFRCNSFRASGTMIRFRIGPSFLCRAVGTVMLLLGLPELVQPEHVVTRAAYNGGEQQRQGALLSLPSHLAPCQPARHPFVSKVVRPSLSKYRREHTNHLP